MSRLAHILVRQREGYPHEALEAGCRAAGLTPQFGHGGKLDPEVVLVTWTPWRGSLADRAGEQHRARGGAWIVCENGYFNDVEGNRYISMALCGYNGWGHSLPSGLLSDRFDALGLAIQPWREEGEHILLVGQAGGTDARFTMPTGWPDDVIERIRAVTDRPIIYRPKPTRPLPLLRKHAGVTTADPHVPISELFQGAWAAVIHSSKVSAYALLHGTPVLYDGESCVLSSLYGRGVELVEDPPMPERKPFFDDLAYAQWSHDEIASGEPFHWLLNLHEACREKPTLANEVA